MVKKKIGTWNGVPVYTDFLPIGTRRTGQRLVSGNPKFAVFHDTGNRDSTAQNNVDYYRNTYNIDWAYTASAHVFVDDKECIICIPVTEKAWHVLYDTPIDNKWYGDDANDIAFGLEACYFSDRNRTLKSLDNACRIMGRCVILGILIHVMKCLAIKIFSLISKTQVTFWKRQVMAGTTCMLLMI